MCKVPVTVTGYHGSTEEGAIIQPRTFRGRTSKVMAEKTARVEKRQHEAEKQLLQGP